MYVSLERLFFRLLLTFLIYILVYTQTPILFGGTFFKFVILSFTFCCCCCCLVPIYFSLNRILSWFHFCFMESLFLNHYSMGSILSEFTLNYSSYLFSVLLFILLLLFLSSFYLLSVWSFLLTVIFLLWV